MSRIYAPRSAVRVEVEIEQRRVHRLLAEKAERRALGPLVDQRDSTRSSGQARARGRRAAPAASALRTEIAGSRPEPEAVTASTGTGAPRTGPRAPGRRPRAARRRRSSFGLRRPEVGGRAGRGVVAVRRPPTGAGTNQPGPRTAARAAPSRRPRRPADERAVRLLGEQHLAGGGDRGRVASPQTTVRTTTMSSAALS